jgi:hypothetical protein
VALQWHAYAREALPSQEGTLVDSKLPRSGTINDPLTIHFHQGLIEVCQRSVVGDDSQSHTQSHISAAKGEHQTHTSGVEVPCWWWLCIMTHTEPTRQRADPPRIGACVCGRALEARLRLTMRPSRLPPPLAGPRVWRG